MAHNAATRRELGVSGGNDSASPPLTPVARGEARGAHDEDDALGDALFGAVGFGDDTTPDEGDAAAAAQDMGEALLASSAERDFGVMLLVGVTTRFSQPLRSLLIAYCLLVFGATLVTAAPNRITADQLRVTALHTLSSPSTSDRIMPPALLFITLHGDRVPTTAPSAGSSSTVVTSVGNALARFRITGLHSLDGSQPLRLEQLPSVALYPLVEGDGGDVTESSGSSLLMPRGMAVLGDNALLVASAADDAPGRPKGSILAVSALNACAVTNDVAAHAPPAEAPKGGGKRKGSSPAEVVSVPARVLWSNGAHHPYGVATSSSNPSRMFVSNQGNGRSYVIDTDTGNAILELPRHCVSQQPAAATASADSGTTGLRGIAANGDGSRVYVACKDDNAVYVHDAATGVQVDAIAVDQPIAVLWGDLGGAAGQGVEGLFIGSDSATSDKAGEVRVFFWDASQARIVIQYRTADGGGHAAGLARVGGALLVLGQDAGALHQFDAASGRFIATLVSGLHRPEAIQLWTGGCE